MFKKFLAYPIHLVFFPALFVVHHAFSILADIGEGRFTNLQSTAVLIGACLICCVPVLILYKGLAWKRDSVKSAIGATILFIPFFFFQDIFLLTKFAFSIRIRWILLILPILTIALAAAVLFSRRKLLLLNEYLNILSITLFGYMVFTIVTHYDKLKPIHYGAQPIPTKIRCQDCPDIYFFLLDSYTSNKSLRDHFGFSNVGFTSELSSLGFVVNDSAKSQYTKTYYSMAATFNLGPEENLEKYYEGDMPKLVERSIVVNSLLGRGYQIANFSIFDLPGHKKHYQITFESGILFLDAILKQTLLRWVYESVSHYQNMYAIHRGILMAAPDINSKSKQIHPLFVYAHILAPHAPFVIGTNGQPIEWRIGGRSQADSYIDQVEGLNVLVLRAIKQIRSHSPGSIIIIQGDHGSRIFEGTQKEDESLTVFQAYFGLSGPIPEDWPSNKIFSKVLEEIDGDIGH